MDHLNRQIFQQPRCLINSLKCGVLEVEKDVLDEVSKIKERLVIVAIVGLYRTGKSFLMNRLAQSETGFPLGKTIRSETKGIWIWAKKHPTQRDTVMLLVDTEGLGDIEKVVHYTSAYRNHTFERNKILTRFLKLFNFQF